MATLNNTDGSGGRFIPEIWAKEVQIARDADLVAAKVVDRTYESEAGAGDVVHIPQAPLLTAVNVTAGSPVTPVAPAETMVDILLDKHKAQAIQISDKLSRQKKYDIAGIYGKEIGRALSKAIDTDVLAEGIAGSTVAAVDGTTGVNLANIVSAIAALDAENTPLDDRHLIVDPVTMSDLRKIAEFTRYDATGRGGVQSAEDANKGLVGHVYGIPVYMTTNVQQGVVATVNKHKNLLLHRSALALVIQKDVTMETDRTALNLADDVIGSCIYGVKAVRPKHVVQLLRNV